MKLSGEHLIPASQQTVWEALNDADMLRACLPGCETLEKISDTEMTAKITTKIGPVKATFTGAVTLSDLDPPNGYKLSGEGQGGTAGFASGSASVNLSEQDGGTLLRYEVEAKVGGKLAQIGSRLIDSVTKKLAAQFFTSLVEKLSPGEKTDTAPESAESAESAPASATPATAAAASPSRRGIPTPAWVVGIIGLVAVLILWAAGVF
ncbi:MAG: carbon monoxide dehydrogenase subunit G [Proteobacteria bacterium]|nr:carbon monoxide dehydrogenase subunit G [Pseudomonadota bacterium]MDA1356864.1 carbon monoxide dehydrogenase subunit G [Pseudomonadota bacterium]